MLHVVMIIGLLIILARTFTKKDALYDPKDTDDYSNTYRHHPDEGI